MVDKYWGTEEAVEGLLATPSKEESLSLLLSFCFEVYVHWNLPSPSLRKPSLSFASAVKKEKGDR